MVKNTKFISHSTIIDTETGVELDRPDYNIEFPKLIKIESNFLKVYKRAIASLNKLDLARLCALQPNLEWRTNRLVNKHVGRYPVPLKQKDMALIMNVTERTISSFIKRLIEEKAIFRFDSEYYINPSFVGSSTSYDTEIIIKMIEEDQQLKSYLGRRALNQIRSFKRIENMNW